MGTAGKIGVGLVILAAAVGVTYVVVRLVRKGKAKTVGVPESTSVAGMQALTMQAAAPPPKPSAKMAGRKRHSRWSKLRSIARTGVRVGAMAGVPGAGNVAALGVV
jgi:hypothetical protein